MPDNQIRVDFSVKLDIQEIAKLPKPQADAVLAGLAKVLTVQCPAAAPLTSDIDAAQRLR